MNAELMTRKCSLQKRKKYFVFPLLISCLIKGEELVVDTCFPHLTKVLVVCVDLEKKIKTTRGKYCIQKEYYDISTISESLTIHWNVLEASSTAIYTVVDEWIQNTICILSKIVIHVMQKDRVREKNVSFEAVPQPVLQTLRLSLILQLSK